MPVFRYVRQFLGSLFSRRRGPLVRSYLLPSKALERNVMVDVYRPALPPWRLLRLVVFNDGQDLPRMDLREQLAAAYADGALPPTLVVGVHAADRLREYGTAGRLDYQGRGDQSAAYAQFMTEELTPWIERHYNVFRAPAKRAVAGFSLGGLSAFDLAWHHPEQFGVVGVFSGSLWWRSKAYDPARPDADLIVHNYVRRAKRVPALRCWFMAGTADETSDRNHNGVIDAIDDTRQLMDALTDRGYDRERQLAYVEVEGGTHDPETWGRVVMAFLGWV